MSILRSYPLAAKLAPRGTSAIDTGESRGRLPPKTPLAVSPGDEPAKRLSQVIDHARPWFLAVEADDQAHVARGIIPGGDGSSRVATLAYDPHWGLLRIDVRLPRPSLAAERYIQACLGGLNARTRLTKLWWDDGELWLRAASVCPRLSDDDARFVFRKVARDVHCVLRDEMLRHLLSEDLNGEAGSRVKGGSR